MDMHLDSRAKGAIGTLIVQLLVGWALFTGLAGGALPDRIDDQLATFDVASDPPAPKPVQPPQPDTRRSAHRDAPAPPALRATPTEVVAPRPIVPPLAPPPIFAAPVASVGAAPTAGAADTPGPGTGAGGIGNGVGGGGSGDGGGRHTPPKWLKGRLKASDYPSAAGEAGVGHQLTVRYRVWTDGRVVDCRVLVSTGAPVLDATACRLIEERYRFKPSKDENGQPVPSQIEEDYTWFVGAEPDH